jgi:hypothetical protein
MLADEKFNEILDAISHQATTSLLFLSRRIPPCGSGGEYLQGRCARVVQRDATVPADRIFAQPRTRSAGSIEYDEDLAALWGDLDAEARTATIPVDDILCRRRECINRALGQLQSWHGVTLSARDCYLDPE